jgi:REP element-mobilizing transposase RayT
LSRPLRLEFPGALWHITQRGNERKDIFRCEADRTLFIELLVRSIETYRWIVHSFVLMTNHYHLIVETPIPTLSRGMHDLDGDYAQKFNQRHGRVGHLFQGRFKGSLVEKETYLLELCRYVVLNPVRAGMVETPAAWRWSSYRATALLEPPPPWLEVDWTLRQFGPDRRSAARRYREFVAAGVGMTRSPWEDLKSDLYLGSDAFGAQLRDVIGARNFAAEIPRAQRLARIPDLDAIVELVLGAFSIGAAQLRNGRRSEARLAFAWLARRTRGSSLGEIGVVLSLSTPGVSHLLRAAEERVRRDATFGELAEQLRRRLTSNNSEKRKA